MPRIIQIILTLLLSIVFLPLILIITLILGMQGNVFFKQQRIGKGNQPFILYKFRTMNAIDPAESTSDIHKTKRITPFGKILRRFSMDELPQFWNVLMGDMNLVGPRPLPVEYLPRMDELTRRRYQVRPGITGWTQVNGRNALSWDKKFEMDRWYIENRSSVLDLKILLMTLPAVFRKIGINQDENVTMEEFNGAGSLSADEAGSKLEAGCSNEKD